MVVGSIFLYLLGLIILINILRKKRASILIIWPYVIYGAGLPIAMFGLSKDFFPFSEYYTSHNVFLSQFVMLSAILIIYMLDVAFLPKNIFDSWIVKIKSFKSKYTIRIVNSKVFKFFIGMHFLCFLILFCLSYTTGEFEFMKYEYETLDELIYWGPISYITENLVVLISLYIYNLYFFRDEVNRNIFIEIFMVVFIFIRLLMGTRLFLVKMIAVSLLVYLIYKRKYIRFFLSIVAIISVMSLLILFRSGESLERFNWDTILSSFFLESYFNDLTLLIASNSLLSTDCYFYPEIIFSKMAFSLPSFFGRAEIMSDLYDYRVALKYINSDVVSPLGAMSFFADLIYGFYWFYILFLVGFFYLIIKYFQIEKGSFGFFVCLILGETSLNLWRDSFGFAFKIIFVHFIANISILVVANYFFEKYHFVFKKNKINDKQLKNDSLKMKGS